ncbi:hypothetical protein F1188_16065 [Roseospira marina]|uniref:Uncharacterized protein n=1 Tax=Roseospira marina TaxID=140057 RepID=A0A5M6I814_9PROT|nr:hypothetical protein [Roseospira marina]KAA5604376.1 hypothetical protein F1188_16065 [Roseospira marina]MBB4315437.1 hypothetical protein [Roseospira marina]MBB5088417.1 hypothetical protein [Roseospira marina]
MKIYTAIIETANTDDARPLAASFTTRQEAEDFLRTFVRRTLTKLAAHDPGLQDRLRAGENPIAFFWGDNADPEENWTIVETEKPGVLLTPDEAKAVEFLASCGQCGHSVSGMSRVTPNILRENLNIDDPSKTLQFAFAKLRGETS